jgi:hypothetical protein
MTRERLAAVVWVLTWAVAAVWSLLWCDGMPRGGALFLGTDDAVFQGASDALPHLTAGLALGQQDFGYEYRYTGARGHSQLRSTWSCILPLVTSSRHCEVDKSASRVGPLMWFR